MDDAAVVPVVAILRCERDRGVARSCDDAAESRDCSPPTDAVAQLCQGSFTNEHHGLLECPCCSAPIARLVERERLGESLFSFDRQRGTRLLVRRLSHVLLPFRPAQVSAQPGPRLGHRRSAMCRIQLLANQ
jgi:hypothetical protein